jgi:Holliday junction DNA helicase RuvB
MMKDENDFGADFSAIVRADIASNFDDNDGSLRPQLLKDFLGQTTVKNNLSTFIEAARLRKEPLDHLLLIGPPGLGKTTLAQITAHELGVDFKVTSAPALEKPKDLAGILSTITERTVFFIDEIHRLKPAIEEMLYIAMEDFELDWIIGQGAAARTVRIPIPFNEVVNSIPIHFSSESAVCMPAIYAISIMNERIKKYRISISSTFFLYIDSLIIN